MVCIKCSFTSKRTDLFSCHRCVSGQTDRPGVHQGVCPYTYTKLIKKKQKKNTHNKNCPRFWQGREGLPPCTHAKKHLEKNLDCLCKTQAITFFFLLLLSCIFVTNKLFIKLLMNLKHQPESSMSHKRSFIILTVLLWQWGCKCGGKMRA